LLKEPDANAYTEGLKALRGVQASAVAGTVPKVLQFLKNSNTHLMRDACRTLAAIGNKDLIPQIEPLLKNPERAVRLDAQDAINALQSKT
jgi:HEAT repeat protein